MKFCLVFLLFFESLSSSFAKDTTPQGIDCRHLVLGTLFNPLHPVGEAVDYLKSLRSLEFDHKKYKDYYFFFEDVILKNKPEPLTRALKTPKDAETFVALLDLQFQKTMYPNAHFGALFQSAPIEIKDWIRILRSKLQSSTFTAEDLKILSRSYYALSRKIPMNRVEYFLTPPTRGMAQIVDYQAELLFLEHSLKKVFFQLGMNEMIPKIGSITKRATKASFRVAGGFLGLKDESLLIKMASSEPFLKRVAEVGYAPALREFIPFFEKEISGTVRWERFIQVSGAVFASYLTYELVRCLLPPLKVSPEEMRKFLLARWKEDQELALGVKIEESDSELNFVKLAFDKYDINTLTDEYNQAKACK